MVQRLINFKELRVRIGGVAASTAYELLAAKLLPPRIRIGRRNYWTEAEIDAWIDGLAQKRDDRRPGQSAGHPGQAAQQAQGDDRERGRAVGRGAGAVAGGGLPMNRRKDNIFGNRKPAWLKTWRGFGSGPKLMLLALRDYRALVMFDEFEQMRATLPPEAPAASSSSPEEFPIDFTLAS